MLCELSGMSRRSLAIAAGTSMSRIHVECPDCNGIFDVKAFRAGHRVACKLCGSVVRVPTDSVPVAETPADESIRETRPVLKRMAFSESQSEPGDAIYDDIFEDTTEVVSRSRQSTLRQFTLTPKLVLRVGVAIFVLLAIYIAYQAGRGSAPVAPSPGPGIPAAPNPTR
jgi:ribosomal protein S27E